MAVEPAESTPSFALGGDEIVGEDKVVTLPNAITLTRLLCLPVFLWLLLSEGDRFAAAFTLGLIGATDWVDGFLARRLNQVSTVGKILDPVADRLWFFVGIGAILYDGSVPVVVAVLVLAREALISIATVGLAVAGGARVNVTWAGKKATFLLMFTFPAFLAGNSTVSWADAATVAAWIAAIPGLALSYYALFRYVPMAKEALDAGRSAR